MAFSSKPYSIIARLLALLALIHGLAAVFFQLGGTSDFKAPIETLGNIAFAITILSALLRLLAAVGLWSLTAWGGVLLIIANIIELGAGVGPVNILDFSPLEIGLRVLVLLAVSALLIGANWTRIKQGYYL